MTEPKFRLVWFTIGVSGSNKTSGTNYRKDFAHGVKSTRSGGSSYSEDSQSRNNSPRMYHNKYAPMTRFVWHRLH